MGRTVVRGMASRAGQSWGQAPALVYLCLTLAVTSPLLLPAQDPGHTPATACCQENEGTPKDEGLPCLSHPSATLSLAGALTLTHLAG